MALWEVKLQNTLSHGVFYTYLNGLTELSTFLMGLDKDYVVRSVKRLDAGSVKASSYFIAKDKSMETGVSSQ